MKSNEFKSLKEKLQIAAKAIYDSNVADSKLNELYPFLVTSVTEKELVWYLKDDFLNLCNNQIITGKIIEEYELFFNSNDIYLNHYVKNAFILVTESNKLEVGGCTKVFACDYANIFIDDHAEAQATDNVYVIAGGNAVLEVGNNVNVEAREFVKITAYGESNLMVCDNVEVLCVESVSVSGDGCSTINAYDYCTLHVSDNSTVIAHDNVVIYANGNANITAEGFCNIVSESNDISFAICENAILRFTTKPYRIFLGNSYCQSNIFYSQNCPDYNLTDHTAFDA